MFVCIIVYSYVWVYAYASFSQARPCWPKPRQESQMCPSIPFPAPISSRCSLEWVRPEWEVRSPWAYCIRTINATFAYTINMCYLSCMYVYARSFQRSPRECAMHYLHRRNRCRRPAARPRRRRRWIAHNIMEVLHNIIDTLQHRAKCIGTILMTSMYVSVYLLPRRQWWERKHPQPAAGGNGRVRCIHQCRCLGGKIFDRECLSDSLLASYIHT